MGGVFLTLEGSVTLLVQVVRLWCRVNRRTPREVGMVFFSSLVVEGFVGWVQGTVCAASLSR